MTYCVGLKLQAGLVLLSDTRTNAGVDNIARFRKMFVFEEPGERVVTLLCAGNLGITQGVVFPSPGWGRDFYWSSMGRLARIYPQ